jgi:hypothetical protein
MASCRSAREPSSSAARTWNVFLKADRARRMVALAGLMAGEAWTSKNWPALAKAPQRVRPAKARSRQDQC